MKDKTLFPPPPQTLTDRQQAALEHLQANPAGVRSIDLGMYLHQAFTKPCSCASTTFASTACHWAHSTGEEVGKALRDKQPPLAIKRRTGKWEALVAAPVDLTIDPFPPGY